MLYAAAPVRSEDGNVLQFVYLATPLPETQWSAFPISVRWQLGLVFLASILIACLDGLLLARRISRPLEKLVGAAHAVAAGDLDQCVPEDSGIPELAMVGHAFNTMTTSLRHADQAKTAFISDVTHELRTPLTVVMGTIETLQDGALDDLAGREALLTSMARETERLIKLVNDLLVPRSPLIQQLPEHLYARCHRLLRLPKPHDLHFLAYLNDPSLYPARHNGAPA